LDPNHWWRREIEGWGTQLIKPYNAAMVRALATLFAALLGLAFGSFLNVCIARWPEGESVVKPRSHCRHCGQTLGWRDNLPLASWLALRGRCRNCQSWIGCRYPLVEFSVALIWALLAWQTVPAFATPGWTATSMFDASFYALQRAILCWLLIGLAVLDAQHFWLPDRLTLGGAVLGLPFAFVSFAVHWIWPKAPFHWGSNWYTHRAHVFELVLHWTIGIIVAPSIILFTRWAYRLVRRREGIGLGDAKLMLLLAVWLGLLHTLLAFVLGVFFGFILALVVLFVPRTRREAKTWVMTKLPFGTCLCLGGTISALYGAPIIDAYARAANIF
jgi:leader peptidase (prepilin peptidase)/N-methyltransferase